MRENLSVMPVVSIINYIRLVTVLVDIPVDLLRKLYLTWSGCILIYLDTDDTLETYCFHLLELSSFWVLHIACIFSFP